MAIYNRTIQDMTIRATGMSSSDGKRVGYIEMQVRNGALDIGTLAVRVKQTGPTIRTHWYHDGCLIPKHVAVRIMRQHEAFLPNQSAPADKGQREQVACMPVERCYDVRAKMIIAFNEARKIGGDLGDGLDAAYKAALRYSPNPMLAEQPAPVAVVMPDLTDLREYHIKAAGDLKSYADGSGMRESDVKHYRKRAAVHDAFVATIDRVSK